MAAVPVAARSEEQPLELTVKEYATPIFPAAVPRVLFHGLGPLPCRRPAGSAATGAKSKPVAD
jgi:hypothetical protein